MPNDSWCCWPASVAAAGPPLHCTGQPAAAPPPQLLKRPQHNLTLGRPTHHPRVAGDANVAGEVVLREGA